MRVLLVFASTLVASSLAYGGWCINGRVGHIHRTAVGDRSSVTASVCCPASCERCGGTDCWAQPGGLACCAEHMHALGAPKCETQTDTGCVLQRPTLLELPDSEREAGCIDVWSAAFPGEQDDWQGHSCAYKVSIPRSTSPRAASFCVC